MTDAEHTAAEHAPPPKRGALGRYGMWAAQALIVLALLDGLVDLAYPAARTIWRAAMPSAADVASRPAGWTNYRERSVAGLGKIVEPVSGPGLQVDALGVRSTGTPRRDGAQGILLGSSQAFGHYVADDATLAAAIERSRADINVAVIAGPARTTAQSMLHWRHLAARIDAPDFAIFLFSNVELYLACEPVSAQSEHEPALIAIPKRMLHRIGAIPKEYPCATPEARTAVVEQSLYQLRAALEYGRQQNTQFAVVIAPLLYGNESNAAGLRGSLDTDFFNSLDLTVREFRARIAAENLPGVIDLSAAFDGNGDAYFSDSSSHFSRAGADALAARVIERLPDTFFEASR
ncbi:hypothetical protein [Blastomonas aquatica]|uniref:SGNH hydrolase-type esterase domain-containing protein n=1 Tax=Blastomonas aquatica TaxID=1510276 RepID=A0ABQ1J0M6_9SPHN|nr:hypothetical protein [Blastomonas aquatica]GGB55117.1 hypothetical protein GCM10010833_07260 [Blastomonas aquatica]